MTMSEKLPIGSIHATIISTKSVHQPKVEEIMLAESWFDSSVSLHNWRSIDWPVLPWTHPLMICPGLLITQLASLLKHCYENSIFGFYYLHSQFSRKLQQIAKWGIFLSLFGWVFKSYSSYVGCCFLRYFNLGFQVIKPRRSGWNLEWSFASKTSFKILWASSIRFLA
jgi:hypothetical protein